MATTAGENVIIANGRAPGKLAKIVAGELVGTFFLAQGQAIPAWKRWIGFTAQPAAPDRSTPGPGGRSKTRAKPAGRSAVVEPTASLRKGDVVALRDAPASNSPAA